MKISLSEEEGVVEIPKIFFWKYREHNFEPGSESLGRKEIGDKADNQMPRILVPYEGWADYHSLGYGGDKAEFTEERADLG